MIRIMGSWLGRRMIRYRVKSLYQQLPFLSDEIAFEFYVQLRFRATALLRNIVAAP